MTKRAPALLVVGAALFVAAVITWLVTRPHPVVRTQTTVIEAPVTTPLPRDSGPVNNRRSKTTTTRRSGPSPIGTSLPGEGRSQSGTPGAQNRLLPSPKRKRPRTKAKRRPSPQRPKQPAQPSNPPPPKQCPPVNVGAPVPVGVTTPLVGVNC